MKKLIITEEEKNTILGLYYNKLLEQDLPQNQRQLRQNIRQATRDENKANREFERERAQAKRTAKSNYDAQMKSRQEMEKKLADYENMVKNYGNTESVKPYLPQYNKAIADLKAQLGQQPQGNVAMTSGVSGAQPTTTQPTTTNQTMVAQPAAGQTEVNVPTTQYTLPTTTGQQTSTPIAGTTTPVPPTAIPTKSVTRINTAPTLSGYDVQTKTTQPTTTTQPTAAQPVATTPQTSTEKTNTTNDNAFYYILKDVKYYFKGKGSYAANTQVGKKRQVQVLIT